MQPWGSIFRSGFLGEVLFKSDLPGVVLIRVSWESEQAFQSLAINQSSILTIMGKSEHRIGWRQKYYVGKNG